MYYLRTMAASAPIQFTVDQASLAADAEVKSVKKRPARPIPAPMMEPKPSENGTVTSEEESDDAHVEKLTVVGSAEPKPSPKSPKKANGVAKKKRDDMDELERSIYDEEVIACSIKNPEACEMCSA